MIFEESRTKSRGRKPLDTIRVVRKRGKSKTHPVFEFCVFAIAVCFLLTLSFWGTVSAYDLKQKTDIFKLFKSGKYLVIFQNNAELRPSGGFIGSFATITFRDYEVEQVDFNTNIYKLDNAFVKDNQIFPPKPLVGISKNRWSLHDANFNVSFPEAAEDIQWFYNQETKGLSNEAGQKVDGVIAINASLIQDLLRYTGPIYLEEYDLSISADNFYSELAQKIEKEYFYDAQKHTENEPKTILKELMPVLFTKMMALQKTDLIKLTLNALQKKQVLLQSNDQQVEQAILASNWGGKIRTTQSDYLSINNANITDLSQQKNGGAKTSLSIKEGIDYRVNREDGLVGKLTLTRSHVGSYTWPDGVNINWTRILAPAGSKLETAELNGKDILNEIEVGQTAGKTYFGLWINTAPQTSNILTLTYKLPISANNYNLLVQKQSGNPDDDLNVVFDNKVLFNGLLTKDLVIK